MSRSASSRSRTQGINQRVLTAPRSEWRIERYDQLPDQLKRILDTYPPFLTTKRAAELNGGGRSKLYEDKEAGYIDAWKSGGSTLWGTHSIVMRLANLPPAASNHLPRHFEPDPDVLAEFMAEMAEAEERQATTSAESVAAE
jgi:hypothetical protein